MVAADGRVDRRHTGVLGLPGLGRAAAKALAAPDGWLDRLGHSDDVRPGHGRLGSAGDVGVHPQGG